MPTGTAGSEKELSYSGRFLSDTALATLLTGLRGGRQPRSLSLDNNLLSDQGVAALAAALHGCPSLTALDLRRNQITASGASCLAQVSALLLARRRPSSLPPFSFLPFALRCPAPLNGHGIDVMCCWFGFI